jgi:hypothetical protein
VREAADVESSGDADGTIGGCGGDAPLAVVGVADAVEAEDGDAVGGADEVPTSELPNRSAGSFPGILRSLLGVYSSCTARSALYSLSLSPPASSGLRLRARATGLLTV